MISPETVVPVTVRADVVGGVDCVVPMMFARVVSLPNMQTGRVAKVTPAKVNVNVTVPDVLLVNVPAMLVLEAFTATVPATFVLVGDAPMPAIIPKRLRADMSLAAVLFGTQVLTISRVPAIIDKHPDPPPRLMSWEGAPDAPEQV